MGVGYLDNNFLAELGDSDLGSDPTAPPPSVPLPGEPGYVEMIALPGGITMPKQTFYIIVGVLIALAIYFHMKNKKTESEEES